MLAAAVAVHLLLEQMEHHKLVVMAAMELHQA